MIPNIDILTDKEREEALNKAITEKQRHIDECKIPFPYYKETIYSAEKFVKLLDKFCQNVTVNGTLISNHFDENKSVFRLHITNEKVDFYADIKQVWEQKPYFVVYTKMKEENNEQIQKNIN